MILIIRGRKKKKKARACKLQVFLPARRKDTYKQDSSFSISEAIKNSNFSMFLQQKYCAKGHSGSSPLCLLNSFSLQATLHLSCCRPDVYFVFIEHLCPQELKQGTLSTVLFLISSSNSCHTGLDCQVHFN